jgi:hypothetical protein
MQALNKQKNKIDSIKILKVAMLVLVLSSLFFALSMNTQTVKGADGTTGTIELSTSSATVGTSVIVHVYGLTADADYLINTTNDASWKSFSPSGTEKQWTYYNIQAPSSGEDVVFYLRYQSAGTIISQDTVQVNALTTQVPISPLIILFVIGFVVTLVGGFIVKKRRG